MPIGCADVSEAAGAAPQHPFDGPSPLESLLQPVLYPLAQPASSASSIGSNTSDVSPRVTKTRRKLLAMLKLAAAHSGCAIMSL